MSTWHQQRARVQLWHATQWTVVTDPPNECRSVMRFETSGAAEQFLKVAGEHSYIIRPQGDTPNRVRAAAKRVAQRIADRIDGFDRDDLGESPDY